MSTGIAAVAAVSGGARNPRGGGAAAPPTTVPWAHCDVAPQREATRDEWNELIGCVCVSEFPS